MSEFLNQVMAAIIGVLVPLLLRHVSKRSVSPIEQHRRELRTRIAELREFSSNSSELPNTAETAAALQHAREELAACLEELATLSKPGAELPQTTGQRVLRNLAAALLLHPARRPSGWVFRGLFFALSTLVSIGVIQGIQAGAFANGEFVAGILVSGVLAVLLRFAASGADRNYQLQTRSPLRAALLLYRPPSGRAALFQFAFYSFASVFVIGGALVLSTRTPGSTDVVIVLTVFLVAALLSRYTARSFDVEAQPTSTVPAPDVRRMSRRQLISGMVGATAATSGFVYARLWEDGSSPAASNRPAVSISHPRHPARDRRKAHRSRPVWNDSSLIANLPRRFDPSSPGAPEGDIVIHWPLAAVFALRYRVADRNQRKLAVEDVGPFLEKYSRARINAGQAGTVLEILALRELAGGMTRPGVSPTTRRRTPPQFSRDALERSMGHLGAARDAGVATWRTYELAARVICLRDADDPDLAYRRFLEFVGPDSRWATANPAEKRWRTIPLLVKNADAFRAWHRYTNSDERPKYRFTLLKRVDAAVAMTS